MPLLKKEVLIKNKYNTIMLLHISPAQQKLMLTKYLEILNDIFFLCINVYHSVCI